MHLTSTGKTSKITMAEVARRAGVSKAAVSVAFSPGTGKIGLSAATREHILKIAAAAGYTPNLMARSLARQQSYLIAFLNREAYFVFALDTIKGIETVLREQNYSLLTYYDGSWAEDQSRQLQLALDRKVDGLIIAGAPEKKGGPNQLRIAALQKEGVPVVQVYRRIFPNVPVVMTDESAAGYQATRHLLELGHRRIAHVTHAGFEDRQLPGTHADARLRAQGYARAMREAGLKPSIISYPVSEAHGLNYTQQVEPAADRVRQGKFTGVTCFCDYVAVGLMNQLIQAGLRIPDDLSVVGYDNCDLSAMTQPTLTTLGQPVRQIGATAARMIFALKIGQPVEDVIFQPQLEVRGSTAPVRANV